jgi:TPR repeat protein
MAKSHSVIDAEQSGVDEFVTAERYLKGTLGTTPDSRTAAQWFWKAVGDGNLAATMALSDLYLRGDGVSKSCDQARLLLDAAARKGAPAAAERLRHLQAFGCD